MRARRTRTHTNPLVILLVPIFFGWDKSLLIPLSIHDNIEYETILAFYALFLSFLLFIFSMILLDVKVLFFFFCVSAVICFYMIFPLKVIIQWPSPFSHTHACIHNIQRNMLIKFSTQLNYTHTVNAPRNKSHPILVAGFFSHMINSTLTMVTRVKRLYMPNIKCNQRRKKKMLNKLWLNLITIMIRWQHNIRSYRLLKRITNQILWLECEYICMYLYIYK